MREAEKYKDGQDMSLFKRVDSVSVYNHEYYVGLDNDLLFALAGDETGATEWFLIIGIESFYLGVSYVDDDHILERFSERFT